MKSSLLWAMAGLAALTVSAGCGGTATQPAPGATTKALEDTAPSTHAVDGADPVVLKYLAEVGLELSDLTVGTDIPLTATASATPSPSDASGSVGNEPAIAAEKIDIKWANTGDSTALVLLAVKDGTGDISGKELFPEYAAIEVPSGEDLSDQKHYRIEPLYSEVTVQASVTIVPDYEDQPKRWAMTGIAQGCRTAFSMVVACEHGNKFIQSQGDMDPPTVSWPSTMSSTDPNWVKFDVS